MLPFKNLWHILNYIFILLFDLRFSAKFPFEQLVIFDKTKLYGLRHSSYDEREIVKNANCHNSAIRPSANSVLCFNIWYIVCKQEKTRCYYQNHKFIDKLFHVIRWSIIRFSLTNVNYYNRVKQNRNHYLETWQALHKKEQQAHHHSS